MKRVLWAPAAQADLARIDDFNAQRNLDFAEKVTREAISAGHFLLQYPAAGPIVQGDDRKWGVPGTDYILVYHVVPEGIEVLRVYHDRENWRRPT